MSEAPAPPVVPRPELLPLNDPGLSWERFEAFCCELVSSFAEILECHHYGGSGDWQRGVDLVARSATGERWVYQCRRYRRYGQVQAQQTVAAATYEADQYVLLLSCEARAPVRDVFEPLSNWQVWDVRDISRKTRSLRAADAQRVVETHFGPLWRRAFLGLRGLRVFVPSQQFFQPYLDETRLFNHAWTIVGRETQLERLLDFVTTDDHRVLVLPGRGGSGKSRLLKGLADEAGVADAPWHLLFTVENVPLDLSRSAEAIPHG